MKILDRNIYLANYDNCCPCGYLYVDKNEHDIINKTTQKKYLLLSITK